MLPTAFGGDVFEARLRGFFVTLLATFFRATCFVALPFVLFLAINASSSWWRSSGSHSTSTAATWYRPATRSAVE